MNHQLMFILLKELSKGGDIIKIEKTTDHLIAGENIEIKGETIQNFLNTYQFCSRCKTFKNKECFSLSERYCKICRKKLRDAIREKNKENLMSCVCGKNINKTYLSKHLQTNFHLANIEKNKL